MNGSPPLPKRAEDTTEEGDSEEQSAGLDAAATNDDLPAKTPCWGGLINAFRRNWEDEDKLDDRVSGSGRVLEMDKDEFEAYLASYEPGGMSPWRHWFRSRSVFLLPLLAPWGRFYRYWYLWVLVLDLTYTAFVFPFNEAWRIGNRAMYSVEAALGFCFVMDVVINLHAPYVLRFKNAKLLLRDGIHIFWLYLTEDTFIIDTITACTFFVITVSVLSPNIDTTSNAWGYARAIRLLRLYRIYLIMKTLVLGTWVHAFVSMRAAKAMFSIRSVYLLGMSYSALVLINCLACLWWFVGNPKDADATNNWPSNAGGLGSIVDYPHWQQYVSSIYYVVTTITTTGYGDIVPHSTVEQIFAMLTMGCGALFFAFLIGSVVGQIMQSGAAARRSAKFKEKIQVVEQFMKTNCVSKDLHNKIFRFYSDVWMRQQEEEELWDSITDLGPTLRAQLLVEMVAPYIRALPPFASLSDLAMLALSGLLEPLPLAPEMDICKLGDAADCMWILQEGSVVQLKGEKRVGGAIWAPGLLGTEALKPALGRGTEPSPGSLRQQESVAGSARSRGVQGAEMPVPARPSEEEEEVVQPFTLRTLRTCTLFCLPVPKLMSLLSSIDPWEAFEIEAGLRLAMESAGQLLGHASRKAVRPSPRVDSVSSKSRKSAATRSSLGTSGTGGPGGSSRPHHSSLLKRALHLPSKSTLAGRDRSIVTHASPAPALEAAHSVITIAREPEPPSTLLPGSSSAPVT